MTEILKEAKRLHDAGFAILWVKPKSKAPIGSGWTSGDRQGWGDLERTYRPGMNMGVRTGLASKIGDGYLACIDIDVKDPAYAEIASQKLGEVVADLGIKGRAPEVKSGSGGGSRHIYCVTKKTFKMITMVKEKDKYEICLYSDGRQMVLPGSIHPSGKVYAWATDIEGGIPTADISKYIGNHATPTNGAGKAAVDEKFEFTAVDVDIEWLPGISDKILKGIIHGTDVDDRSLFLLHCCRALCSAGLSRDEILSVLSDPRYYISSAAYDRRGDKNRRSAAQWLWQYCLREVLESRSAATYFGVVGEDASIKLSPEAEAAQTAELLAEMQTSADNGFYYRGKNNALIPDYDMLLQHFVADRPFKTIVDMKAIYTFNGTHFEDCTGFEIKGFAETHFSPKPSEKIRTEFWHKLLANNIERRSFFNDTTEGKINFKNGVLDLNHSDSDLLSHSPDLGFRGVLPYDFNPKAECPVFLEWIDGIMLGDKELIAILQEFMGYIVRGGAYKYHKALWLGGVGRNGKSTFVDILKALIGKNNFSVLSIKSLVGDRFAGSDLDGKIANFSEETSPQELADSGPFKNLTGDGDFFAQKKFGHPYYFRNRAKLIMTYNQIPDLRDLSPGMMSRPIIIPFRKIIAEGDQDRGIKEKLYAELPGIFNYALEGWQRLESQEGFTKSARSEGALRRIKEESCNVYQWVENNFTFDLTDEAADVLAESQILASKTRCYRWRDLFKIYCKQEKYTFKGPEFCRRLNAHPRIKNRKKKGAKFNFYHHLTVNV